MKKKVVIFLSVIIIVIGIFQVVNYVEPLPTSEYITLSRGNLAYDVYGTGDKNLIMIHGSPGSKKTFEKLASSINPDYTVYALDMFCFGESTMELDDCGIEVATETINEFMDVMEIESASVLGYSWGGSVVITFAHSYPERVDNLILLSGNGIQEGEPTKSFWIERIRSWIAYPFAVYYPGAFSGDYRWKRGFIKSFVDGDLRPIERKLGEIEVGALVLHGREDTIIKPWVAEKHNLLLPNSRLEYFSGNHVTISKDVTEIAPLINDFLGGLK